MTEDGKEGYFASILVRVLPHPPFDVDVHQTLTDDLAGSRKEVDDLKRELKKLILLHRKRYKILRKL